MWYRLTPARGPVRVVAALLLGLSIAGCGFMPLAQAPGDLRLAALTETSEYQLFVLPDEGQAPVLKAIREAATSLEVAVYMLSSPEVIAALAEAHGRGVAVRVLMEPEPFNPTNPNAPLPTNRRAYDALTAAGVQVRYLKEPFNYLHQKTLIVDGRCAIVMTANLSRAAFESNREYGLINRSPSDVSEIRAMFEADWGHTEFAPQDPDLVVSPINARARLKAFIGRARRSVAVQVEVLGDPEISQALGARAKAGIDVRVQLAKFDGGNTNERELAELAAAGVQQVRFIRRPNMHAKLIVVDGEAAYLGSVNLTTNSLDRNRELGVIVREAAIVRRLAQVADQDWGDRD